MGRAAGGGGRVESCEPPALSEGGGGADGGRRSSLRSRSWKRGAEELAAGQGWCCPGRGWAEPQRCPGGENGFWGGPWPPGALCQRWQCAQRPGWEPRRRWGRRDAPVRAKRPSSARPRNAPAPRVRVGEFRRDRLYPHLGSKPGAAAAPGAPSAGSQRPSLRPCRAGSSISGKPVEISPRVAALQLQAEKKLTRRAKAVCFFNFFSNFCFKCRVSLIRLSCYLSPCLFFKAL